MKFVEQRSVAQFGRALRSGRRGRVFESRRFDKINIKFLLTFCGSFYIMKFVEQRSVAQFGRALRSGRRGRVFESRRFD